MAEIIVENLQRSVGSTEILKGISARIADGQFAVLVGPSGCGKSTLLRLIAGLDSPTAGTIQIGGQIVNDLPPRERDIAMVFQSYALYPHMTVAENMGFALKLRGMDSAEIAGAVGRAAEILSLTPLLGRKPRELSGGQRQRVAMGRAIVRNPRAFLFDEPLSNLDARLRVQMRAEIRTLHTQLASTSVYVTHDQLEAMTLADLILVMRDGQIEQMGPPTRIYDDPDNVFVAEFIGSPAINLLPGVVESGRFIGPGSFWFDCETRVPSGLQLLCGIRPEFLRPTSAPDRGFAMRVQLIENTGSDVHVTGQVGGATIRAVVGRQVALPKVSELLRLEVQGGAPFLFDASTGRRVRPAT
jgi:multiple sugar transport system ATP-binding protein